VALLVVGVSFDALTKDGVGLFLPVISHDLAMSYSDGGSLASLRTLTYALTQIPAGYLADRFGAKRLFLAGIVATMVLTVHFGMVTQF
jgi:MFS family permease